MAHKEGLTRRELIEKCLTMGALTLAPGVSVADALECPDRDLGGRQ